MLRTQPCVLCAVHITWPFDTPPALRVHYTRTHGDPRELVIAPSPLVFHELAAPPLVVAWIDRLMREARGGETGRVVMWAVGVGIDQVGRAVIDRGIGQRAGEGIGSKDLTVVRPLTNITWVN